VNNVCCNTACNGQCDGSCSSGTCASAAGKQCTPTAVGAATGTCDANHACRVQSCDATHCLNGGTCQAWTSTKCGTGCIDCTTGTATMHVTSATCDATGHCQLTCGPSSTAGANYADCNHNPADGCETDLGMDPNCGACGQVCTSCGITMPMPAWCAPVCASYPGNCYCGTFVMGPPPQVCFF
jgi:hypothetical protein